MPKDIQLIAAKPCRDGGQLVERVRRRWRLELAADYQPWCLTKTTQPPEPDNIIRNCIRSFWMENGQNREI